MKSRPNKIRDLPAEQRKQVEAWLFQDGLTYDDIVSLAQEQFGLPLSPSTLSEYRQGLEKKARIDQALDRALARITQSNAEASAQMEAIDHLKTQYPEALMTRASQLAFEKSLKGEKFDLEELKAFMEIAAVPLKVKGDTVKAAQKDRSLDQADRRIKLLEEREAKTKSVIGDTTLTPEEKESRMKEILGM